MADPATIHIGDQVTHPEWPEGTTRTVTSISFFRRGGWERGRYKVRDDPTTRVCHLDAEVEGDDAWMEAGLTVSQSAS
jgi:hypothetical protein